MTPSLLTRLRQDLPAEWTAIFPPAKPMCWYEDPRTVGIMIGDRVLFVSFRQRGGWVGSLGYKRRCYTWGDLIAAAPGAAADVALFHAREGKPIPVVPPWAMQALCAEQARRLKQLAYVDAHTTAHLTQIRTERAILSALTLGA